MSFINHAGARGRVTATVLVGTLCLTAAGGTVAHAADRAGAVSVSGATPAAAATVQPTDPYEPSPHHDTDGAPVLPAPIGGVLPTMRVAQAAPAPGDAARVASPQAGAAAAGAASAASAAGVAGARAAALLPSTQAPSTLMGLQSGATGFAAYPSDLAEAWRLLSFDAARDSADPMRVAAQDDHRAFTAALNARMATLQYGWDDPRIPTLFERVYATQKPSGGYGLEKAWDVFDDGTVNPKDTIYTVTTAGHVGAILLEGYAHGIVPRERIVEVLVAVLTIPVFEARVGGTSYGACMAYSNQRADALPAGGCIINVSLGAAVFLQRAIASGALQGDSKRITRAQRLVDRLAPLALRTYRASIGGWPYQIGTARVQDLSHNAYTFASASELYGATRFRAGALKALRHTTYAPDPSAKNGSFDPIGQMAMYAAMPSVPADHGWALGLYTARLMKRMKTPSLSGQAALAFYSMHRRGDSDPLWKTATAMRLTAVDGYGRAVTGGSATTKSVRYTATVLDEKARPLIGVPVTFDVTAGAGASPVPSAQSRWTEYDGTAAVTVPAGRTVTASVPNGFTAGKTVRRSMTVAAASSR